MAYKLLLADDSVTIQRVIELTFADEDFQVIAVGDGRQAIERITADHPDIVLADVGMPERDGFEVAAYVKQTPELRHIPVLLLTGAFEPVDEGRVREVGCDGVLAKPFEPQMLIARVKELLAGASRGQQANVPPAGPAFATQDDETTVIIESEAVADPVLDSFDVTPAQAPDSRAAVDEYFDRLDAAFAARETAPPPAADESLASPASDDWSPVELPTFDPLDQAAAAPSRSPAPELAPSVTVAPDTAIIGATPEVSAAFGRLLAEEQGDRAPFGTVRFAPPSPATISIDGIVDEVTRRVIERLADRSLHEQVADIVSTVAERLVREEIDRLKAGLK